MKAVTSFGITLFMYANAPGKYVTFSQSFFEADIAER
jgi:hypothetical protein